ncbi:MAG: phosphate signaling complex protein PhoU [Chloroflexi bacterium]|nr:MAG: phosphate signaling complex protein PhoU [Chloroflexota bacterium]
MNGLELGVQALGKRVDAALADALTALRERDLGLADRVVRADLEINRLRYALEEQASAKLAETSDPLEVRTLVATLYVLSDLERIGDHAEGIAKVTLMLGPHPALSIPSVMVTMSQQVQAMVTRTLAALHRRDVDEARRLCGEDDEIDALYDRAYGELLSAMTGNRDIVSHATYLLWVTHNLERIADRTTNICERVVYLVTGRVEELNVSKY